MFVYITTNDARKLLSVCAEYTKRANPSNHDRPDDWFIAKLPSCFFTDGYLKIREKHAQEIANISAHKYACAHIQKGKNCFGVEYIALKIVSTGDEIRGENPLLIEPDRGIFDLEKIYDSFQEHKHETA